METWSKLFGSILDSSIWCESKETRLVWVTMLAMKDAVGFVSASLPGLAKRAGVSLDECEEAIRVITSPDKHSRSKEHDGRRAEAVDGGWVVLNHFKYRDGLDGQRAKWRAQKARQRQAKQSQSVTFTGDALADKREDPEGAVMREKGANGL